MKIVIKNNSIIKEIGLKDFNEITKSKKPYVIKFTNPTCYLCKGLKHIFEEIAEEYKEKYKFGNVNSRLERQMFKLFKVDGVPEIFIIHNNNLSNIKYPEEPDPISGYSKDYITQHLDAYLNKTESNNE